LISQSQVGVALALFLRCLPGTFNVAPAGLTAGLTVNPNFKSVNPNFRL